MKYKLFTVLALVMALTLLLVTPALAHDGVGGDEYAAADAMWVFALAFVAMAGVGILFSFTNGEFRHPEKIKYIMLERAMVDDDGDEIDQYAITEAQY